MKNTPASRSNGTQNNPCAQFIRLTEEQNIRLHRARKWRGTSVQTFGHTAIMREILAVESEMAARAQEKQLARTPAAAAPARTAKGLGIRERLAEEGPRPSSSANTSPPEVAPQAPTVTVQVNAAPASTGGTDIETLARMVVDGGPDKRRQLLESACRTLARSARTREDTIRLADLLDAEIKRISPAKPQTVLERVRARSKKQ